MPVLRVDPDLAAGMDAVRRTAAEKVCLARELELPAGHWDATTFPADVDETGYGLLVISGILCRRVVQDGSRGAELLGAGDLLRPSDLPGQWRSVPAESSWQVIETARLAVLDDDFARRAAPYPEVARGLIRHSLQRSRHLALLMAIVGQHRLETRLNMLFWHLADRFGQMRGEWVVIPLPLTHSLLAELVVARRPSVTTALTRLRDLGVLQRDGDAWLVRPAPLPQGV